MLTSRNILHIESMVLQEDDYMGSFLNRIMCITHEVLLNARIDFTHPETGDVLSSYNIQAMGTDVEPDIAARKCIENFMNKRYVSSGISVHEPQSDSPSEDLKIEKNKVHQIVVHLDNTLLRKMFYDLFDLTNWSLQDKTLNQC